MSFTPKRFSRPVNGILLLDKPIGLTSNTALQVIKRLFAARKAGHTGSLDPLASGMLPICFGEATKFSQYLLDSDKHYQVVAQLGVKTTTGDTEGEIIQQKSVGDSKGLDQIIKKFHGTIMQVPSMYSALKYQGRPLYELARKGITVERPARSVQIHKLDLLAKTTDTLTLEVVCSKGTYIRTLVEDIGDALGCGAHVAELRRLGVNDYPANQMIGLSQLEKIAQDHPGDYTVLDNLLLSLDTAVQHWPLVNLSQAAAFYLLRGQPVIVPRAPTQGWVRLMLNDGSFIGVGEILDDGRVAPRRLMQKE